MPTSWITKPRFAKSVGMGLLVPVALVLMLVAFNRFDEPLSADTQAWLDYPGPHAAEKSNAYLASQPDYAPARKQSLMQLAAAERALQANDAQTAYREWARQQGVWQRAAEEAMTVDGLLQTALELEHGQMILAGMLQRHPESAGVARQYALPVLQSQAGLETLFARALVRQFQLAAHAITGKADEQAKAEGWAGRLYLLFYQRNASLNLANRMFRDYMAQHGIALDGKIPAANPAHAACGAEKNWFALTNQYGRHLICMARIDYSAERQRIAQSDADIHRLKVALAEKQ